MRYHEHNQNHSYWCPDNVLALLHWNMLLTEPEVLSLFIETIQGPCLTSIGIATITDFVRYCDEDVACMGEELLAVEDGG